MIPRIKICDINQSRRRLISMTILCLAAGAFGLLGEFFGEGLALFSTGNWKYVWSFWAVVIVMAIPGILLLVGHVKRAISPPADVDRAFWIFSLVYNAVLFLPLAYLVMSGFNMLMGRFERAVPLTAAFPAMGIVLSFVALRLR